jgi:glycolate oxidase FAD binding subunit
MINSIQNYDNTDYLISQVKDAYSKKLPLQIVAGNSKIFYGRKISYKEITLNSHSGVINYEPSELVITVRAGTPLSEINTELEKNSQMLAFEPPSYNSNSTIGGTIACGLSGSRRPFTGAARDFVLGTRILNGKGELLKFGGEVIKNVAGYDTSRLMTGALGTLGVLLDVSIKVIPRPEYEVTLIQTLSLDSALNQMTYLKRQTHPISGLAYCFNHLFIRLSGTQNTVKNSVRSIGGDYYSNSKSDLDFSWNKFDNHTLKFFNSERALWRISVKPNTPKLNIKGECFYNWAGAERWITSNCKNTEIFNTVAAVNGHATLYRFGDRTNDIFQPLPAALLKIHQELKKSFDPENILNPGKLYSEI